MTRDECTKLLELIGDYGGACFNGNEDDIARSRARVLHALAAHVAPALALPCRTELCERAATLRVFWPGQTTEMCAPCAERAQATARAMGFALAEEPL